MEILRSQEPKILDLWSGRWGLELLTVVRLSVDAISCYYGSLLHSKEAHRQVTSTTCSPHVRVRQTANTLPEQQAEF